MNPSRTLAVFLVLLLSGSAQAYEALTHAEISRQAARQSGLDATLRDRYGVVFGLDTPLLDHPASDWIAFGGFMEDSPATRVVNHFHQPLNPWPLAGLVLSSVLWQQFPHQDWSWPVARQHFADSLLAPSQAGRDEALASVLRSLGQMAHLIQDATSPAHARRDLHPPFFNPDGYETHVEDLRVANPARFLQLLQGPPVRPDPDIFTPTGSDTAPSRIARLIDSDTFNGDVGSYATGGLIGASEYTNGGYVSDDTVFLDFALPRQSSLDPAGFFEQAPGGTAARRQYFSKVADGDSVKHFVAEGSLWDRLRLFSLPAAYIVDDRTYEDAAARLMPRAVGYSAALFDYFFREQLEISSPGRFVYGRALYKPDKPELGYGQFTKLRAKVRNKNPDEPIAGGTLIAVVRYRLLVGSGGLQTDSFKEPVSPITVDTFQSVSKPITVASVDGTFQEQEFDFSASPIPVNAVDVRLIAVFQGQVDAEGSGVAVGIKDLLEPDPVDYVNGTDWECFQGTLYHVADPALFPPGDPGARDIDGNNTVDLFAPFVEENFRLLTSPLSAPALPTDTQFDLKVPLVDGSDGAPTARVVILQDQPAYATGINRDSVVGFGSFISVGPALFLFGGIQNDIVTTPLGPRHRITLNGTYRGLPFFHDIVLVTTATLPCFPQTATLKPDGTLLSSPPMEVNP